MGCRAEYRTRAVVLHQFLYGQHAGIQIFTWQHLGFIKNNHTLSQVVQFAAARRFIGKQRLKELNVGCDNNRNVPILRSQFQFVQNVFGLVVRRLRFFVALRSPIKVGMMFKDILFAQTFFEYPRVLLDNRGKRNDIDNVFQSVLDRVIQRKCHRGQRLAAAGWNRKGEKSLF